ncbi:olfactory receptor class A-like protein 1 [Protopterus annectens]|uniref:olfactory receptor class A-like protein 1 n=1 Tax=Protopterus annectens TaxID=7888 RepID=UPI001CFA8CA0|nr:olfactory receptor class A-like protein 1 [Protopterus annectens]
MELRQILKGVAFLLTTVFGFTGNVVVLMSLSSTAHQQNKMLPADIILTLLTGSNIVLLITVGLPNSLFNLGIKLFYTDLDCKINLYIDRVSRVMTISLTCLLSCLQSVTLACSNPKWIPLKYNMQKYLILIICFLGVLGASSSVNAVLYSVVTTNFTDQKPTAHLGYCFVVYPDWLILQIIGFFIFTRDFIFVILMALASCHILFMLYKHGKQMKGKRSSDRIRETTTEQQVAKMVVSFVTLYVTFFGLENGIWFYQMSDKGAHPDLSNVRHFLSFCFPSSFPAVTVIFNQKIRFKLKCGSVDHVARRL